MQRMVSFFALSAEIILEFICVYRCLIFSIASFIGAGRVYMMEMNGVRIQDMKHGGYYAMQVSPGLVELEAGHHEKCLRQSTAQSIELAFVPAAKLDFNAEAGKNYYVKMHPEAHFDYFLPKLFLMPDADGMNEIAS